MVLSYIIGIAGITTLMVIWLVIQRQWGKVFENQFKDDDVLAGRSSCGNCGCTNYCESKNNVNK